MPLGTGEQQDAAATGQPPTVEGGDDFSLPLSLDTEVVLKYIKSLFAEINKNPKSLDAYTIKILRGMELFLGNYGWMNSVKNWNCEDGSGSPIPWYTFSATEFLSSIDFSDCQVLEYGSGNSTLWWQSRVKKLVSVESDRAWFDRVSKQFVNKTNVEYKFCDDRENYVNQSELEKSDVIIIDGAFRRQCSEAVTDAISGTGRARPFLIVFDNSDWYPKTIRSFGERNSSWFQVDFSGFGPINDYTWTTTLFINSAADPNRLRSQKISSLGSLPQVGADDEPR